LASRVELTAALVCDVFRERFATFALGTGDLVLVFHSGRAGVMVDLA